jgi:rubredoxin
MSFYGFVDQGDKLSHQQRFNAAVQGALSMDKWECGVCGYVYDPAEGDPSSGVAQGTAFEDLPESWVCPECGSPKGVFKRLG